MRSVYSGGWLVACGGEGCDIRARARIDWARAFGRVADRLSHVVGGGAG
jgi:hypothetical protein